MRVVVVVPSSSVLLLLMMMMMMAVVVPAATPAEAVLAIPAGGEGPVGDHASAGGRGLVVVVRLLLLLLRDGVRRGHVVVWDPTRVVTAPLLVRQAGV